MNAGRAFGDSGRRLASALLLSGFASVVNASPSADTAHAPAARWTESDAASSPGHAKGGGFAMARHVIASGGGSSSGGVFVIQGTIGQSDADPLHPASGGVFAITGGFWPGLAPGAAPGDPIFANGFEPGAP